MNRQVNPPGEDHLAGWRRGMGRAARGLAGSLRFLLDGLERAAQSGGSLDDCLVRQSLAEASSLVAATLAFLDGLAAAGSPDPVDESDTFAAAQGPDMSRDTSSFLTCCSCWRHRAFCPYQG